MTKDIAKQDTLPRFNPDSDILEREDGFHIFMDLPGVAKEDLVIDLKENELEISGKAEYSVKETAKDVHIEFGSGTYVRRFTISDAVDAEKIKATMKNGVLELYLPKAEKAKPKKIEIHAE
ncbi:Hsp20/alpha crystallin family protein [Desulfoplanes sp. PS50]